MTETTTATTAPPPYQRTGARGMLPSTWTGRTLRVEYVDGQGHGQEATAMLLDIYPLGPVLNVQGGKTLLVWDRLVLAELVEG